MLPCFALAWFLGAPQFASAQATGSSEEDAFTDTRNITRFDWLDPEKEVYVVQNRKYQKAGHLSLSVMGGLGLSNPYRTSAVIDPRLGYFFKEWIGIEGFYGFQFHTPNGTQEALEYASPNALPVVREIQSYIGGQVVFAPIYAKLNLFDTIIYLDWLFSVGAGVLQTRVNTKTQVGAPDIFVAQTLFSPMISTGHMIHVSKSFYFRWDLMGSIYSAPSFGTTGTSVLNSAFQLTAGIGARL